MTDIRVAHTADLDQATLRAARELLDVAYDGEFGDHDWEHSLGGMHALAYDGGDLVGHGSVVQRRMLHGGRALRAGYLEGMGVRPDRRRRGIGGAMMAELIRIVRGGYDVGVLSATDAGVPLYRATGWLPWEGTTSVLTPRGAERTPEDDDAVWVLPASVELDRAGDLTCDWRDGDVW